ncbi:DUF1553 domain-containing protein [Botrimarina hoheduenensis]|nr:DUF1553 domain-containing protein [Botrimarina hoheduenensis]
MSRIRLNADSAAGHSPLVSVPSLAATVVLAVTAAACADEAIDFNRDVRPILSDKCFFCHGPAEDSREAGLRLDLRDEAIDYGAIVEGDAESSLVIERIHEADPELLMPPPEAKKPLTEAEKETLRRWIESGAAYAQHWSFRPLPAEVETPKSGDDWARSPIDRFVHRRLQSAKLRPNREADRRTWLRRVTLDLTGLPPALDEIDAFLVDKSPDAYERVVDRLLESDAHAERIASEWLDVARYSDSYGFQRDDERFVWPYRDWVIEAFRRNQPYDEFVTWQLAGDLLPEPTREQRLATVFCRLHSHKKEGGSVVEEFRVENVADRTHTFASAFLGLTMECARCHDHKFDPITMKDYYGLTSFFANVDERGLISYFTDATPTPAMPLPSVEQEAALSVAERGVRKAEEKLKEAEHKASQRFVAWEANVVPGELSIPGIVARIDFDEQDPSPPEELLFEEDGGFVETNQKPLKPDTVRAFVNRIDQSRPAITNKLNEVVEGVAGNGVRLTGDDSVVVPGVGHIERHEPISVSIWVRPNEVDERGVIWRRSRGWDDAGSIGYALVQRGAHLRANIAHFWPGNAIAIETGDVLSSGQWTHITVTYDGSSRADGLRIYVDGEAAETSVVQDSLTRTINDWRAGYYDLAIGSRFRDRGFKGGVVDDFRVYDRTLTPIEVRHGFDGEALAFADEGDLLSYYVSAIDPAVRAARDELRDARTRWNEVMDGIPAITVMHERSEPRPAYILERGAYDNHGEKVVACSPHFLPAFPEDQPADRLGLARWLFEPNHPLTARVAVNRYWQMLFGAGLVRTPEDFGSQSEPPSHPELLDWLARDFVNGGWDVRRLLRTMVLSATYRQSSVVSPEVREIDPENRLLSRGPSNRLSAEMVRDNALAVSGLLVNRVGGPPVKPYDLALAYTPLDTGSGEELYRRSLYTFWKRTSPSPVMMTMNANRREVCLLKRDMVSSPLQALVLLNGTQFVEAARVYAQRLIQEHGHEIEPLIGEAFESLTGRPAETEEIGVLVAAYEEQLAVFRADAQAAEEFLTVGAATYSDSVDCAQLAAATVLINSIMNLDEAIRCR